MVNHERNQPPLCIDVAMFGAGAEACAEYLAKGRAVAVTGRLVRTSSGAESPKAAVDGKRKK